MKAGLVSLAAVWLALGCGASGGPGPSNTAGASSGGNGSGGGTAGAPGAGMSNGGSKAGAGASGGGNSTSGSGNGGNAGSGGGAGGSSAGNAAKGFECPAGPFEAPNLGGTPMRVPGVPPSDTFNNNNGFSNIEGDVWMDGALYVSEIPSAPSNPPPARILKITADDQVSIVMPDSGSNGLAVDPTGQLFGALHSDGSVSKLDLTAKTATPVVSMFMGMRFGSPNDLTFHSNGTMYFTDPGWQAPDPNPQSETRAYRVAPGGQPEVIPGVTNKPNGITLSKDEDYLYIASLDPLRRYPVMPDGSLGTGADFGSNASGIDGMVIDCAGNLYAASGAQGVKVFDPTGTSLGTITVSGVTEATNVAFGGADHTTLYISGQGSSATQKGLFKLAMNVPGYPY